jgi:hypothetical protein
VKLQVGMTVADRSPRTNYARATIDALLAQGIRHDRFHVFSSAPDVAWLGSTEGFTLHIPNRRFTRNENGLALLRGIPECDWTLHLEDDLVFCDDFLGSVTRWLARYQCNRKVYTFCVMRGQPPVGYEAWDQPQNAWGCMAVALRWRHLQEFATWVERAMPGWRAGMTDGWRKSGFDMMLRQWAGEPFLASNPSFVQHAGRESLTHSFRNRPFIRSPFFAGPSWSYRRADAKTELGSAQA